MAIGLTNTLPRSSCGKCVRVLKELISGLDEEKKKTVDSVKNNDSNTNNYEPPPLTLLRAIARSSQNHPKHDQWGQERKGMTSRRTFTSQSTIVLNQEPQQQQREHPMLTVEETENGVRLTIPVETTDPTSMKKWTHLQQQTIFNSTLDTKSSNTGNDEEVADSILEDDWRIPLATSVRRDETATANKDNNNHHKNVQNPLTIELLCRRCESSGPEAGARAFLMGPQPLSIVLCHNRIDSEREEVEEILTHELVHLYDVQTLQLDLSDCETVAYSEVRAAREAECYRSFQQAALAAAKAEATKEPHSAAVNEFDSDSFHFVDDDALLRPGLVTQITQTLEKHVYQPYCVKKIALGATQNMFPSRGKSCLNKVWEDAYGDHRPFGRNQTKQQQQRPETKHTTSRPEESSGTVNGTSGK